MPYADLPVTRAMQPLKLNPWSDCLDLASSPEDFSQLVRLRLQTGVPAGQRAARARLVDESWEHKACVFEEVALLPGLLATVTS
jgi:hypothetical protein